MACEDCDNIHHMCLKFSNQVLHLQYGYFLEIVCAHAV